MTGEAFSLPAFTMADYNFYRLDDRIFFGFIIAGLIFCAIHAARWAFQQPFSTVLPRGGTGSSDVKEEEIQRHIIF
jgi:hypothetical protein